MSKKTAEPPSDFSLTHGGPLYLLFSRVGLCDDAFDLKCRRIILITAIAWLPLLILSLFEGHAFVGTASIPFLRDITAQGRFLVALPALLLADSIAHEVIAPRIRMFVTRNIIHVDDLPKFRAAIDSSHRMRDSFVAEAVMLLVVYVVGLSFWSSQVASATPTWYAAPEGTSMNLTLAGYWLILVSLPTFQFLFLRWHFRQFIWFVFLFRVSRLNLRLIATHSDRSAGLGFLGQCAYAFMPVLFAEGTLVSAFIANETLYSGRSLADHKLEPVAFALLFLSTALVPLIVFSPKMIKAKWRDLILYGALASKYVEGFDRRWIRGEEPPSKDLLGADDIQSLADLSNSYEVLQSMRPVPFELRDVVSLSIATALPFVPLVFFVFSVEDIADRLLEVLF